MDTKRLSRQSVVCQLQSRILRSLRRLTLWIFQWLEVISQTQPHSPEHMASWMAGRLTRSNVSACIGSRDEMLCKYYRMRQIMEDVLHCCTLSEYNRRRAAYMMSDIADLSDHSSSDEERDPISTFTAGCLMVVAIWWSMTWTSQWRETLVILLAP